METAKLGKRGTLVIPAKLRQRFALKEGDLLVTEEREDGILLRPAVAVPVEIYTPQRKAEFLLNNAVTKEDYDRACRIIQDDFGLDPKRIPNTEDANRDRLPSTREFAQQMKRIRANLTRGETRARRRA